MSDEIQEREVARRVLAAEFDDATLSYSESDEERAPNYVVTPTGARVNRLFAVGALTEVESVNDDVLRGRIADPTGAFVTYAGQYQPDAAAFLERAAPPCFVSITGKGRTYQPDDSERIFTSVRPESLNEVDADTRDRWLVTAAEATLDRLATMATALELDARGDDLRTELESRGVDAALANGVALAIDHYRPTEHYLEAVRWLTVQTLELVADERESVETLDIDPGESGPDELGALPEVTAAAPASADADGAQSASESESAPTAQSAPTSAGAGPARSTPASESAEGQPSASDPSPGETAAPTQDTDDAETHINGADTVTETQSAPSTSETGVMDASDTAAEATTESESAGADGSSDRSGVQSSGTGNLDPPTDEDGADDLGDFGTDEDGADDLSDFGTDEDGADDLGDFGTDEATDELYELDDDERAEIESEFGTEFATGNEVDDPGEADIDVPDVEDLEAEAAATVDPGAEGTGDSATSADGSPSPPDPGTAAGTDAGEPAGADPVTEDGGPDAGSDTDAADDAGPESDGATDDIDLETAVIEVMSELDDGDGARQEAVVSAIVDEHGVDPDAVESAIQEALMGGKCYEPADGRLKAI